MYEIFEKLLNAHGITAYRFCKDTGVNSSTISTWKKNNSIARPELAKIVCEYFDVSADYLMTGEEKEVSEPYYLNDDAREMAQFMFENPEYKVLFDASRKVKKDDIQFVKEMIDRLSNRE